MAQIEAANLRIQQLELGNNRAQHMPPPAAALGRAPSPELEQLPEPQQYQPPQPQQQYQQPQQQMPPPNRGPLNYVLPPAGPPNNPWPGQHIEQPAPMPMMDIQQAILNASTGGLPPSSTTQLGEPISRFFALGATLDMRIKVRIWSGQYVDLASLAIAIGRHSLTVNMDNGQPTLSLATPHAEPIEHIWAWLRLFFTYASIYSERRPQEAPGLFTYAVRILDLQRRYRGTM